MDDRRRAAALAAQASPILHTLGMRPFAQQAAQLTETLARRMPLALPQHAACLDDLSRQEVDVYLRMAHGRTNFLG